MCVMSPIIITKSRLTIQISLLVTPVIFESTEKNMQIIEKTCRYTCRQ